MPSQLARRRWISYMFGYSRFVPRFIRFFGGELGSLLLLYLAFMAAGFVATNILLLIMVANPHLDPDTLSLKVAAFTSQDGPVALFVVWCLTIILFAWWKPTQAIIRYYGKRLEEFSIVLFSAFLGTVLAIGLWQLGWENLLHTLFFSALAVGLSVAARRLISLDGRDNQVVAVALAAVALLLFTFGPAFWPTWLSDYVTL